MAWRDSLRPASFRGVTFHVETAAKAGGRRGVTYEYPKRDTPSDEDLGRRARRFNLSLYLVGEDHHQQANALQTALDAKGPGTLVTPLMGSLRVRCEGYNRAERKQEGNITFIDATFVEAGAPPTGGGVEDTGGAVKEAAKQAQTATAESADKTATGNQAAELPDSGVWT